MRVVRAVCCSVRRVVRVVLVRLVLVVMVVLGVMPGLVVTVGPAPRGRRAMSPVAMVATVVMRVLLVLVVLAARLVVRERLRVLRVRRVWEQVRSPVMVAMVVRVSVRWLRVSPGVTVVSAGPPVTTAPGVTAA